MASSINASTSGAGGVITTADATGILNIQSAGTTVAAVSSTGLAVTGTGSVSGDLSFNSGYGSAAVAYGCRAWVNFNGTGTVAIRASGNVSSITDNGTGDYTVNFTTAMPDANYNINGNNQAIAGTANPWIVINGYSGPTYQSPTTAACRIFCQQNGAGYDSAFINLSFFR